MIAGKFRLTRQLGQGGMGSVWAAAHQTLGREVAVKFLQPEAANSQVLTNRFVVDVFDFGVTEDGLHYMVLELLHGRSLADRMDHGPALPVRTAVKLMADCLRGLHVVHEAGIVHRDLKPDNIFVIDDADGAFPKLIDFGISRRTDPPNLKLSPSEARKSRLTQPGVVLGTPFYMSPEQLRGKQSVDARSDIYSYGVILYELLAGHLPFRQDNIGDLMVAITVTGAPALMEIRPELGVRLSNVVARAMAPAPEDRYADALQLRKALLELLPELPEGALCVVQTEVRTPSECAQPWKPEAAALQPLPATSPRALLPGKSWARVRGPAVIAVAAGLATAVLLWIVMRQVTREPVQAGLLPAHQRRDTTLVAPLPRESVSRPSARAPSAPEPPEPPEPPELIAPAPAPAKVKQSEPPSAATRAARERPHTHDTKARASSPDRPQRIYRKLDF